jgi:hypothetical protein
VTIWRWTESDANLSLGEFPLTGKIQGTFTHSGPPIVGFSSVYGMICSISFPAVKREQGILPIYQGILSRQTGIRKPTRIVIMDDEPASRYLSFQGPVKGEFYF